MTTTAPTDLSGLAQAVGCQVVLPGDRDYNRLRAVWNADIDRRPAAIVRCTTAEHVSAGLTWCRERNLPITVRGGGHNLAGTAVADGAVLIDTRLLAAVRVDQAAGLVHVGAGCIWGEVDRACEDLGIAVPAGVVSHTGVAGLTLGGGFGYLARQFGPTIDHLEEVEVVVADGRILTANREQHPDLFWALKGAGHNYGIATRFTFRYVALPGLATVRIHLYGADDRLAVLRAFRDRAVDAPRQVGSYLRLYTSPEYWSQLPAAHRGKPVLSLATVTYGDPADEPRLTAPLYEGPEPIYTSVRTLPHVTLQHATDDEFRYGLRHYWKHAFLRELPDEALDVLLHWSDAYPGHPLNASASIAHQVMCPFEMFAGSPEAPVQRDDALPEIGSMRFAANIGADWEFPEEKPELVAWARGFSAALDPWQTGTYINFTSVQGDDDVARAVYGDKYERLVRVKKEYDPDNVFRRGLVDLSDNGDDTSGART
ncbi:FAD-binding oxidoreductase [Streptomyces sp. NPDC056291]|uniref:FAD-binding oxidoreductase n=1 Tax=Streptomyces sp. NPDC056291 TaxID=3345772 RepID=UPI0035E3342D